MKRDPDLDDIGLIFAITLAVTLVVVTIATVLIATWGFSAPATAPESTVWAPTVSRPSPLPTRASRSRRAAPLPTLNWDALYLCESTRDPRAVSPTGKFRGAFQFSLSSWHLVGMTGDPIDYPYAVQQAAAERLYARQGAGAWPYCGRFLR